MAEHTQLVGKMDETSSGAFLFSLDPELEQQNLPTELAILLNGLFAKRTGLTDAQILNSTALQWFVDKNRHELQRELDVLSPRGVPLIGSCSRRGTQMFEALDIFLKPKGLHGLPSYLSGFSCDQNKVLHAGCTPSETEEGRRERFLEIAGGHYEWFLQYLTEYFEQRPGSLIAAAEDSPEITFFNEVLKYIEDLKKHQSLASGFRYGDHAMADALIKTIDDATPETPQTREILHEAIYGGHIPRVESGRINYEGVHPSDTDTRLNWRNLVNTIYNGNLADKLGLRGVLNAKWFDLPDRLLDVNAPVPSDNREVVSVELASCVYLEHFTLEFVNDVRREDAFWKSLDTLEHSTNDDAGTKAFADHMQLVSECFAKYLTDKRKRRDLVKKDLCQVASNQVDSAVCAVSTGVAAYGHWFGLPELVVSGLLGTGIGIAGQTQVVINGFLKYLPQPRIAAPGFKSFMKDIRRYGKEVS